MAERRHRGGGLQIGKTLTIVVALHVVGAAGFLFLAKTQAGQEIAKQYNIKLFEPPKPEQAKNEEPPPPPPKVEQPKAPPPDSAPQVASAAPSAAPQIGGGGSVGSGWGGKFAGGDFDGPEGAFHAGVMGKFRKYYPYEEAPDGAQSAELELVVSGDGKVRSYRLTRSSGSGDQDQAILSAAAKVQAEGTATPPEGKGRVVTVRFVPRG
jgi:TonB family protein